MESEEEGGVFMPNEESPEKQNIATTTEQLLHSVGAWNPYALFITVSMASLWMFSAMPTLSPAYLAPSKPCLENCQFVTIQDEFHITRSVVDPGELTASAYFLGNFVLGQVYCIAADRIGRRPVLILSLLISGASGTLASLAPTFELMLVARFFQGSLFSSITMVNWVMCCESIAFSAHAAASVLFGVLWVVGYCIVTPLAIWLGHWRKVQLATSLPTFIMGLVLLFTLPESISFLITRKRRKEAIQWISRASWWERKEIECDVDQIIENETRCVEEEKTLFECLKHIVGRADLRLYLIIQAIIWCVDFMVYNSLSLISTGVGGNNPHYAYLFSGLVELPCYFLMPISLDYFGRKPTVILSHLLSAIALGAMFVIRADAHPTAFLIVWLIAKFGMATTFMCCFVYGAEIFPVQYRNICLGLCATISNLGAMMSPHATILNDYFPGSTFAFYALLAILCAGITTYLPETKHNHKK